jgi:Double zinc ribbon
MPANVAPFAVFGIKHGPVNTAVGVLILVLVVVWLACIFWTFMDARRRIEDPVLVGCAVVASLFPFVGTIVYMIIRPPEFLEDVRERELEIQAAEARLAQAGVHLCPHCDHEVREDYLRCPSCMRKLKDACTNCTKPLEPSWRICPYCETEVPQVTAAARRPPGRRRRETATAEAEPTT